MKTKTIANVSFLFSLTSIVLFAQVPNTPGVFKPDRGFLPYGSYSIADTESVNDFSGGVNLKIPLASLPPGRGGMSHGVSLVYNSQLFDLQTETTVAANVQECTDQPCATSTVQSLHGSINGGWRYSFNYAIEQDVKPYPSGTGSCNLQDTSSLYLIKINAILPDGSSHLMRMKGSTDYVGDGYYRHNTDGTRACPNDVGNLNLTGPDMYYYSTDGSFLQLKISTPTPGAAYSWTLTMPDGRRASGVGGFPSQLCDKNDNCVSINHFAPNGGTAPYTVITDDLGRQIRITYATTTGCTAGPTTCTSSSQDEITAVKYGLIGASTNIATIDHVAATSVLHWTVKWGSVPVAATQPFSYDCTVANVGSKTCIFAGGPRVVSEIITPIGNDPVGSGTYKYSFLYADDNAPYAAGTVNKKGWGEIREVRFPNGVTDATNGYTPRVEYTWLYKPGILGIQRNAINGAENYVTSKTYSFNEGIDESFRQRLWTYKFPFPENQIFGTIIGPDGGTTKNTFFTQTTACGSPGWGGCKGLLSKTESPEGTIIERFWAPNSPYYASAADNSNAYVTSEFRTLAGAPTRVAASLFTYDKNGNQTEKKEYNWQASVPVTGAPSGTALRTTTNTPFTPTAAATAAANQTEANAYWNNFTIRTRTTIKRIVTSDGALKSITELTYDNATATANVLKEARWDNQLVPAEPAADTLSRTNAAVWDRTWYKGNLLTETDPDNHITNITYAQLGNCPTSFNNLYPTQVETAFGQTVKRTTTYSYDCASGVMIGANDVDNSLPATYGYDIYSRLTDIAEANNGRKSATVYDDAYRRVSIGSDHKTASDYLLGTVLDFDQLGGLYKSRSNGDTGGKALPTADANTSIHTVKGERINGGYLWSIQSNPYFVQTTDTTMGWTRRKQDKEGRVLEVESFAGSGQPTPFGTNSTSLGKTTISYAGDTTTTVDPQGSQTVTVVDALGRVSSVSQRSPANTVLSSATYTYNVFDSLISVTQADATNYVPAVTQTRTFIYSTLNRLVSATNPETGTITYEYYPGGALKKKTDARGYVQYTIDGLKRMSSKAHTYTVAITAETPATPAATYCYDGKVYLNGVCTSNAVATGSVKGKLTGYGSQIGGLDAAQNYTAFNDLGQVLTSMQKTPLLGDQIFTYMYHVTGSPKTVTYPSGKVITYTPTDRDLVNTAALTAGGTAMSYLQTPTYTALGGPLSALHGNGTSSESWTYNGKGQMLSHTALKVNGSATLFKQELTYPTGAANNGNIQRQDVTMGAVTFNQQYRYDGINRIRLAVESPAITTGIDIDTTACATYSARWCQRYGADMFGNLWQTDGTGNGAVPLKPAGNGWFYNNGAVTNRMTGVGYDAVGNQWEVMVGDPSKKADYDGENRFVRLRDTAVSGSPTLVSNDYDAEGRRIRKTVGTLVTNYVYGADGHLMAEYKAATTVGTGTQFVVADHLRSTRALVDASGDVVAGSRMDYLPFGTEVADRPATGWSGYRAAGVGASTAVQFTGQLRDSETGLDFFGARYMGGAQGRFTGADAPFADQHPADPQSWNLYSYVRNNPLRFTDATGREVATNCPAADTECAKTEQQGLKNLLTLDTLRGIGQGLVNGFIDTVNLLAEGAQNAEAANVGQPTGGFVGIPHLDAANTNQQTGQTLAGAAMVGVTLFTGGTTAPGLANSIPGTLARVIPGEFATTTTLGRIGSSDVFVTAATDIRGLNASSLAQRLTIPQAKSFTVFEFPSQGVSGLASPINRTNPGFVGGGRTAGGAREFVLPNGPLPSGTRIRVVK